MIATDTAPDITDAPQDVIRAAVGPDRFRAIKLDAVMGGRDVAEAFAAELTDAEKTRIREAIDAGPLDHDALTAGLGADRYRDIWSGVLMPSTPDRYRDAVIRAALAAYTDPITGQSAAEIMAPAPAAPETPAPARKPTPTGLRVSTRRVAGGVDGRDFAYVGLVKLGRTVVAECGHEHANRDWSATVAGGSAKSCAESILDGARRPATAEHTAKRIRTAPIGLRPGGGFEHPAGTIEAARAAAEKNTATYLAAVATVREHMDTLEAPLPGTAPDAAASPEAPAPDQIRARDTFAGGGGWTLAALSLGWHVDGVEIMDEARDTRTAAGFNTVGKDVREVVGTPGEYHAEISSPSCKRYSMQGNGAGRRALDAVITGVEAFRHGTPMSWAEAVALVGDEDAALTLEPLRIALEAEPLYIAWEQVPSVLPVWKACGTVLTERGYSVVTAVLNAEEHGVPQTRQRAVLLARRDGIPASLPTPTHARFGATASPLPRPVSIGDVLGWPEGTVMVSNYGTGGDASKRGVRRWDQPAATITSKADRNKVHEPGKPARNLTLTEAAVLQTFPADHPFQGDKSTRGLQIGNAVPVTLARVMLAAVTSPAAPLITEGNAMTDDQTTRRHLAGGQGRELPPVRLDLTDAEETAALNAAGCYGTSVPGIEAQCGNSEAHGPH